MGGKRVRCEVTISESLFQGRSWGFLMQTHFADDLQNRHSVLEEAPMKDRKRQADVAVVPDTVYL